MIDAEKMKLSKQAMPVVDLPRSGTHASYTNG